MRKFLVEHSKHETIITEAELIPLTLMDDPSLAWRLQPGETFYKRALRPDELVMSWAVFDTEKQAFDTAIFDITVFYRRLAEKTGKPFDEEACNEKLMSIVTFKLGAENAEKRKQHP